MCDSVCECRSKRPASTMCSPAVGSVCRRPSSSPARPSMSPGDQPPCLPCLQVCVQTCAVVYVRTAAVGTTLLCACQCACSLHVRACRLTMQLYLHTLTIQSIPLCTGFLVTLKDRASMTSISTDPRATRQIRAFTWASVHALSALRQISPQADRRRVVSGRRVVSPRTSKSKIVADELFRTSKSIDQEKTLRLQSSVLSATRLLVTAALRRISPPADELLVVDE